MYTAKILQYSDLLGCFLCVYERFVASEFEAQNVINEWYDSHPFIDSDFYASSIEPFCGVL